MEKPIEVQRVKEALAELKARGWTISAIADELAVHRDSVWSWEAGRYTPDKPRLVRIALEGLLRRRRIPKRKRYKKNPPAT
jgi:transcriptional regulator with XRE-family HTH domain